MKFPQALTTLENIISRLRDLDDDKPNSQPPASPSRHPRSSPSSPAPNKKSKRQQSSSPIRHILNSPLLNRRKCKKPPLESSDEDGNEDDNGTLSGAKSSYHDLETFQKAQLRQKVCLQNYFSMLNLRLIIHFYAQLKRGKIEPNGTSSASTHSVPVRREFVMYNKGENNNSPLLFFHP
jgi:tubby-related protein 4